MDQSLYLNKSFSGRKKLTNWKFTNDLTLSDSLKESKKFLQTQHKNNMSEVESVTDALVYILLLMQDASLFKRSKYGSQISGTISGFVHEVERDVYLKISRIAFVNFCSDSLEKLDSPLARRFLLEYLCVSTGEPVYNDALLKVFIDLAEDNLYNSCQLGLLNLESIERAFIDFCLSEKFSPQIADFLDIQVRERGKSRIFKDDNLVRRIFSFLWKERNYEDLVNKSNLVYMLVYFKRKKLDFVELDQLVDWCFDTKSDPDNIDVIMYYSKLILSFYGDRRHSHIYSVLSKTISFVTLED
jgi:hypothetical protein